MGFRSRTSRELGLAVHLIQKLRLCAQRYEVGQDALFVDLPVPGRGFVFLALLAFPFFSTLLGYLWALWHQVPSRLLSLMLGLPAIWIIRDSGVGNPAADLVLVSRRVSGG